MVETMREYSLTGTGLGLRRDFLDDFLEQKPEAIDFVEVAPENWMTLGGELGDKFSRAAKICPVVLHGLSLSLGGPEALDEYFLHRVKQFMERYDIQVYTEHLSFCSDTGHLYDLMPIPFTQDAIQHVVDRIKKVQDITGKDFAIENVSYYAAPLQKMPEIEFLNQVMEQSDCQLLLDVNNVYVNSINHNYDAVDFLKQIPGDRIVYCHIAGHYQEDEDLIVDTHGADVIDPVWDLLQKTYALFGSLPTLLERDFNIPPLEILLLELQRIKGYQSQAVIESKEQGNVA
jgi:uncharacterized protein (UPF0276 family)